MSVDFPQEVLSETALIADATGMAIPAASAAVPPVCSDLAGAGVHDGGGVTKWCDKCPGAPAPHQFRYQETNGVHRISAFQGATTHLHLPESGHLSRPFALPPQACVALQAVIPLMWR